MTGSMRTRPAGPARVVAAILACLMIGCEAQPQSSRLRASDFEFTITKMAESLAASTFLAERTPESPPVYITINKVENLTSDIIPVAEQWMLVARVQEGLPLRELSKQKNIHFQITPEQHQMLREAGFDGDLGLAPATTHVMTAQFLSTPRTAPHKTEDYVNLRQDYYYLEYAITNVDTRQIEWNDSFEFKRVAAGLTID